MPAWHTWPSQNFYFSLYNPVRNDIVNPICIFSTLHQLLLMMTLAMMAKLKKKKPNQSRDKNNKKKNCNYRNISLSFDMILCGWFYMSTRNCYLFTLKRFSCLLDDLIILFVILSKMNGSFCRQALDYYYISMDLFVMILRGEIEIQSKKLNFYRLLLKLRNFCFLIKKLKYFF